MIIPSAATGVLFLSCELLQPVSNGHATEYGMKPPTILIYRFDLTARLGTHAFIDNTGSHL